MKDTERIYWKVSGMDCTTCALNITKYLSNQGHDNVKVNFAGGEVSFTHTGIQTLDEAEQGINKLGYNVVSKDRYADHSTAPHEHESFTQHWMFFICLICTIPLLLHMLPGVEIHILHNAYLQWILATPVYIIGMYYFGKSAWYSLRNGIANMNVLIVLGATAAYGYSIYGIASGNASEYLFFETTASIITLVFFGNYMEARAISTTQKALHKLVHSQKVMANMIAYDDAHQEQIFRVENNTLRVGDLILINTGEQVPMDCKILWGSVSVNEAIITGESMPVERNMNDKLIGGSILESGSAKAYITATGDDAVLNHIIKLMQEAQGEKPPVQLLADKISAIFVPLVVGIALLTFAGNFFFTDIGFGNSLLRSIAVLVIACPCAMGLATPAAVAVGMGRAARHGILFRNAASLENFKDIKQVVFDKTGTLTTGQFIISQFETSIEKQNFHQIVYSLEKYSSHPLSKSIVQAWKTKDVMKWASTEEIKGIGIKAIDKSGNIFMAGSWKILNNTVDKSHNIYVTKNGELIGWIDLEDEIRTEVKDILQWLKSKQLKTILLSGDRKEKCEALAAQLQIDEVYSEQTPEQKLQKIADFTKHLPTAMIGDGINDAPALAKATIGISLSDASQLAVQSAGVILTNNGLKKLPEAMGLGKHTYLTIQQNLAWAFLYNIIAIPVAAFGFLSPTFGALIMGLSDVVLAINSVRLNFKKIV